MGPVRSSGRGPATPPITTISSRRPTTPLTFVLIAVKDSRVSGFPKPGQ